MRSGHRHCLLASKAFAYYEMGDDMDGSVGKEVMQ